MKLTIVKSTTGEIIEIESLDKVRLTWHKPDEPVKQWHYFETDDPDTGDGN